MATTPIDYDKLGDAVARAMKRGSGSGSGSGFASSGGDAGVNNFKDSLNNAGDAAKDFGTKVKENASEYVDTLRTLTRAGSNFSNDVIGMGVAAAESRLSLKDFSDVIVENGKFLAGLGGSVTRGTEAFAKLSKGFFESEATEELRQMGYTSKELNDVLAIQLGTQRATFQNDEAGRKRAFESAQSLAKEMDMIAKLTGKNREELAEEAKKRRTDGQIESKLRLIGIEKGAAAEAEARSAFQKQFAEAEARGMGQMAKELFATGTLTSEEAATQFAVMGEAASKTRSQMLALADGNVAAAESYSKEAQAATARLQQDPTFLRLGALGDAAGAAGSIVTKNVEANMALNDAVQNVAKTMQPGLTNSLESFGKAVDLVRQNIEDSRAGMREQVDPGTGQKVLKQVDGATSGLIALETGMQNIQAGIASSIEVQNAAGESIGNAARQIGTSTKQLVDSVSPVGVNLGKYIETLATLGQRPAQVNTEGMSDVQRQSAERAAQGGTLGTTVRTASDLSTAAANAFEATTATIKENLIVTGNLQINGGTNIPGRATGSIGETGNIVEDFGAGTLTMLHGKESVLTEDQLKELATGAKTDGVTGAITQLKSALPKPGESLNLGKEPSINVAEISKTISSTISSSISGGETTVKRVKSEEAESAEAELQKLKEQYAEERSALAAKFKEMMPDATGGERRRAMNASDEGKALNSKYDALMDPLEDKIEESIKWEINAKQSLLKENKKIIEESSNDLSNFYVDMNGDLKEWANEIQSTDVPDTSIIQEVNPIADIPKEIPKIDINSFLPGFGQQIKSASSSIPSNKQEEERKAVEAKRKEQERSTTTPAEQPKPVAATPQSGKPASLDDVVKTLNQLNMMMGRLISVTEDQSTKQIRATMANNQNGFVR
jgi:hypothetical protein